MDWLALVGAFGLGSVVTTLVQAWLVSRAKTAERSFRERKEAYIGLLEAWVRQEDNDFDEMSMRDVGHWVLRAELVASAPVFEALQSWKESEPGSTERSGATSDLKGLMRADLA